MFDTGNDYKSDFIELIMTLNQDTDSKHNLIDYLNNETDFFTSPFTTKYQFSYTGGLVKYCLKVYDNLCKLVAINENDINEDTLIVVSLFHCLYKINSFKVISKNIKQYNPSGKKFDELGHFDWISEMGYTYNDEKTTNIYGEPGFSSYMIISRFLALTENEILAIKYFNIWEESKDFSGDIWNLLKQYPLITLLHCAIMMTLTNE